MKNDLNWTGKVARIFVENGRISGLLIFGLFIWGLFSFFQTPKQYNPRITAPAFKISVSFAGATRHEMLEQVTKPLENIIAQIPEVEDLFSVTTEGAQTQLVVNFYVGENPENAKITLTDRINSNLNLAPLGIDAPLIQSIDPDDVPIATIALTSEEVDAIALRKFAFRLRDRLMTIEGTSGINIVGGRRRELNIAVDPLKLRRANIGISEIESALARNNIYLPAGLIKGDEQYTPLETRGVVSNPEELKNIVILSSDITDITLRRLADIREQEVEIEDHVRHRLREKTPQASVLLSIAKLKNANISDVSESIQSKLANLKRDFIPENIQADVIVDEGYVASKEIGRLITNLFTAIVIVVIVLLFFLNLRAALLVAIAIPLTLFTVVGIANLTGQSINRITLFALILSLGLLVDNATVVIENIVRHFNESKSKDRKKIVISAVAEVGPGLFMSTITTVLAFIPMAFVTGMMGPYMGPIPFFVPAALVVSLGLALSINPWLASVILRHETETARDGKVYQLLQKIKGYLGKVTGLAGHLMQLFRNYLQLILNNRAQRRLFFIIIGSLLLASFVLPGIGLVKFRMLPKADREQFFIYVDLPAGSSLEKTLAASQKLEDFLLKQPEVTMVQAYLGHPPILDFNGLFRGVADRRAPHLATIRVGLTEPESRDIQSAKLVLELRPRLLKFIEQAQLGLPLKIKLVEDPPGPPVLSTFLMRVQSYDASLLEPVIDQLKEKTDKVEGVVDTDTSIPEDYETVSLQVNQARATKSQLSSAQIAQTLATAYAGKIVGLYHNQQNLEQEYIRLRLKKEVRIDTRALRNIYLKNALGINVSLASLVTQKKEPTVKPIRRENRRSTAYIYGDMANRSITYAAIDMLWLLADYTPKGASRVDGSLFGATYRYEDGREVEITLGGEWQLTLEVFRDLGAAMGIAILLIYLVLVAQFSSFREALIIMSTIPLSLIGVLPGFLLLFYINGLYFNATSMIGVIALAGIAVNNSIILLEYLKTLGSKKMRLSGALYEAGMTRFRPIMLTTITTILGSLTIASDPVWSGLAYAIILGLGVSSLLTILVFPALYITLKGKDWA